MTASRVCPRCHEKLPLTPEFWHRDRGKPRGFYWYCKACVSELRK